MVEKASDLVQESYSHVHPAGLGVAVLSLHWEWWLCVCVFIISVTSSSLWYHPALVTFLTPYKQSHPKQNFSACSTSKTSCAACSYDLGVQKCALTTPSFMCFLCPSQGLWQHMPSDTKREMMQLSTFKRAGFWREVNSIRILLHLVARSDPSRVSQSY